MNKYVKHKSVPECSIISHQYVHTFLLPVTILNQVCTLFPPSPTQLHALSIRLVNISVSVNELNIKDTRSLVQVSFFSCRPPLLGNSGHDNRTGIEMSEQDKVQVEETQRTARTERWPGRGDAAPTCVLCESTCKMVTRSEAAFI